MSKAKANTDQQKQIAASKHAELKVAEIREVERERRQRREDEERHRKEAEARIRREREARELEAQLDRDRERKRLDRLKVCASSIKHR